MPLSYREKVKQLSEPVRDMLLSDLPPEEIYKATTSYGIPAEGRSKVAELVGLIFVNDVSLEKFSEAIQKLLNVPESVAAGLAFQITKSIFLPIGQYFPQASVLAQTWSQKASPPTQPAQSLGLKTSMQPAVGQPISVPGAGGGDVLERHVPAMMAEREEIANQLITSEPLKFAESEMLKLPSIKNWLYDYHKYKSQFPDQDIAMVRTRYLYESPNAKTLNEQERIILGHVLKSYDERTRLPFSKVTGRLLVEKLIPAQTAPPAPPPPPSPPPPKPQPPSPPPIPQAPPRPPVTVSYPSSLSPSPPTKTVPPSQMPPTPSPSPAPTPTPSPTPAHAIQTPGRDTYREQPEDKDFAGPQAAQRPAPKLNGNVIDLRENNQPTV